MWTSATIYSVEAVSSQFHGRISVPNESPSCIDDFNLVGLSHHTASLDLRSSLALSNDTLPAFLSRLGTEAVALSTCNRTEIYFVGNHLDAVLEAWGRVAGLPPKDFDPHLYHRKGSDCARHLFRVASGLESAVIGENEIMAQVKDAWHLSRKAGVAGNAIASLFEKALVAAKRVRRETHLSRHVLSVASLAVKLAERHAGKLGENKVLLIGAGNTASRVAKELAQRGAVHVTVINRTPSHAKQVAECCGATTVPLTELRMQLQEADLVFSAVSVDQPLITEDLLPDRERPLVIVDLGVPRTCEEAVGNLPNVTLIATDDLAARSVAHNVLRLMEVPGAESIIQEEVSAFGDHCAVRDSSQAIQSIQKSAERIRQENLTRLAKRMEALTPEAILVIEELSQRLAFGLTRSGIHKLRDPQLTHRDRQLIAEAFGAE